MSYLLKFLLRKTKGGRRSSGYWLQGRSQPASTRARSRRVTRSAMKKKTKEVSKDQSVGSARSASGKKPIGVGQNPAYWFGFDLDRMDPQQLWRINWSGHDWKPN